MSGIEVQPISSDAAVADLDLAPVDGWDAMYLDGGWTTDVGDGSITVSNPSTREDMGTVPAGTANDVDDAYDAAAAVQSAWADRPPQARAEVVERARELTEEYEDDLVHLSGVEIGGTPLKAGIELDIARNMMKVSEGLAFALDGGHKDSIVPGKENIIEREPTGVVGVISPWNFPFHLSMRAVAPAIALGNTVVLKPSSNSSLLGGLVLARLFDEAGLPDGVLNVVTGSGADAGEAVSAHPTADVVSFTGSGSVGKQVARNAAGNLALPSLELGGNNAHIVTDDADLERAVDAGTFGSFVHQGQVCISINRHLVQEAVYDEYVERLAERADDLVVGDPLEDDVDVGPIIDESQRDDMIEFVEESVERGATIETGGSHDGLFVEPTVLSDVTNDMPTACNEHFGPIAPVIPFADDAEAVEIANDTRYGLSGSVHSTDLERARNIADAVETGMIHINDQPINDDPHTPFGGVKESGIGRYNGEWIMDELTETKWVSIQREPREYPL